MGGRLPCEAQVAPILSPGHAVSFDAIVHGLGQGRSCGCAACVVAVSVAAPQWGLKGSVYMAGGMVLHSVVAVLGSYLFALVSCHVTAHVLLLCLHRGKGRANEDRFMGLTGRSCATHDVNAFRSSGAAFAGGKAL